MSHNPDATRRIENKTFTPPELLEEHKSDQEFAEWLKFPDNETSIEDVTPVMAPDSTQEVPRSGSLSNLSSAEQLLLSTSLNLAVDLMKSKNEEIDTLKSRLISIREDTTKKVLESLRDNLMGQLLPETGRIPTDPQVISWTQGCNDGVLKAVKYINKQLGEG